jgi:hypothetical protein
MIKKQTLHLVTFEELGTEDPLVASAEGDVITYMAGSTDTVYNAGLLGVAETCTMILPTLAARQHEITHQALDILFSRTVESGMCEELPDTHTFMVVLPPDLDRQLIA